MITEQEFHRKVTNIAAVADSMTLDEFNRSILSLASELTIARNARNRSRLFELVREREQAMQDRKAEIDQAHKTGRDCGLVHCLICNPEVEQS